MHYVVTNGAEGMSNASKLFYDTYKLYHEEPDKFNLILCDFYKKYAENANSIMEKKVWPVILLFNLVS